MRVLDAVKTYYKKRLGKRGRWSRFEHLLSGEGSTKIVFVPAKSGKGATVATEGTRFSPPERFTAQRSPACSCLTLWVHT